MTQAHVTEDLVSRLTENWKAWGSPVDRDKCVNETRMAMDCKEAADEIERLKKIMSVDCQKIMEIDRLREQRTEARMLLDEVQARHASDTMPGRVYDFLVRTKERTAETATLAERDVIEQRVADGELCSADGQPHKIVSGQELYGEDADGNRGRWVDFKRCTKCGEDL